MLLLLNIVNNYILTLRIIDTCDTISSANGISLADFYAWNPAVGSTCTTLLAGYYVCVDIPGVTPTTATTATATGPTPTQTGITSSCKSRLRLIINDTLCIMAMHHSADRILGDEWYEAVSGDTCDAIVAKFSITLAEFYAWNPAVGSTCASLFLGYYYCVGV
jgi:hypothetical protein